MEQRRSEIEINAEGPEQPGPIRRFRVDQITIRESRRSERERWQWLGSERATVLSLSRRELAKLIADGADWLSYVEGGESS